MCHALPAQSRLFQEAALPQALSSPGHTLYDLRPSFTAVVPTAITARVVRWVAGSLPPESQSERAPACPLVHMALAGPSRAWHARDAPSIFK